jgi:hypothetical protein
MKNEGILGFADPDLIDSPPGSSGFPIGKNTPIIFSKAFANPKWEAEHRTVGRDVPGTQKKWTDQAIRPF